MPSIRRVSAVPYSVPLKSALNWGSSHELRGLEHVLIRAELSDGAVGIAEATPRPSIYGETQASVLHIVEHHLAPQLMGQMVTDRQSVARLTGRLSLNQEQQHREGRAGYGGPSGAGGKPRREPGSLP